MKYTLTRLTVTVAALLAATLVYIGPVIAFGETECVENCPGDEGERQVLCYALFGMEGASSECGASAMCPPPGHPDRVEVIHCWEQP